MISTPADAPQQCPRDIIVVGGSAGGVEAVSRIVAELPADFQGSVFVVIHIARAATSVLPAILTRSGRLLAVHPHDRSPIRPGVIYVAPPDHHLMVERGRVRLVRGPAENGSRPALDPLFRSAAAAYGPRVTGVVLSGNLDDGTAGLAEIKRCGGFTIVQDPDEALYPGMIRSAMKHVQVDEVLALDAIAPALERSVRELVDDVSCSEPKLQESEVEMTEANERTATPGGRRGRPSGFTCPDCHGVLWEVHDGELVHYRCRVGHAFSPESLVALDSDAVEEALWTAYRALQESAALARKMAQRAAAHERDLTAMRFEQQAAELDARAAVIGGVLDSGTPRTAGDPEAIVGPE
jgi:two-component system chemotaxis response regulator CheB